MIATLLLLLQGEEFPAKLGMEWRYEGTGAGGVKDPVRKITDVVIVKGTECFYLEDSGAEEVFRELYIDVTQEGVRVFKLSTDIPKSFLLLKFPVASGLRWETALRIGEDEDATRLTFEVQGEEEIQVPAGKFKTWRVLRTAARGDSRSSVTSWYAAGQGEIARKGEGYEFKLKEIVQNRISTSWRREAGPCACDEKMGKGVCKCSHCGGIDKEARCYCGTGGCRCGRDMPDCNCRHCSGCTGGDDGKDNCKCGK
jgi:hypothetical protein